MGDSRYGCLLLHLEVVLIRFTSCLGLAWGFSYSDLLNRIDFGLIPSRIDFSIQLRWTALASLCWVLLWVHPQSLVLLGIVGVGTDLALTLLWVPFFTTSFFISDGVMIDSSTGLTWQMEWTTSFDKLVVVVLLGSLLSGPLSEVWHISSDHLTIAMMEMLEEGILWLDQGVLWQRRFRWRLLPWSASAEPCFRPWHKNKRTEAFSHWWLKASASFWFMD